MTSSERPMLKRQSPMKAYESWSYGLPLCSCIVRKSASICVGCHSAVSPLYTGTPAHRASSSTAAWSLPRYSMASYMRPSTRAVSAIDSLWPICEPDGSR